MGLELGNILYDAKTGSTLDTGVILHGMSASQGVTINAIPAFVKYFALPWNQRCCAQWRRLHVFTSPGLFIYLYILLFGDRLTDKGLGGPLCKWKVLLGVISDLANIKAFFSFSYQIVTENKGAWASCIESYLERDVINSSWCGVDRARGRCSIDCSYRKFAVLMLCTLSRLVHRCSMECGRLVHLLSLTGTHYYSTAQTLQSCEEPCCRWALSISFHFNRSTYVGCVGCCVNEGVPRWLFHHCFYWNPMAVGICKGVHLCSYDETGWQSWLLLELIKMSYYDVQVIKENALQI